MADSLRIRAGNKRGMPTLVDREPAYVRDEKALYMGTPDGNIKLCSSETEGRVETLEGAMNGKLTASKVAAQSDLAGEADIAAVVTAYNNLIAAMKASGVMSTE